MVALLVDVLFFASLIWMMLRLLRMLALARGLKPQPDARKRLSGGERGLLAAGVALVLLLYAVDLYQMLI